MEKYVNFKLISNKDGRIYLGGCIDINTVDDDEPEYEFEQNDGTYNSQIPHYWKINGDDLSTEFEVFVQTIDWEMLNQFLWDFHDEDATVNFYGDLLIINKGSQKSTTIRVKQDTKVRLEAIGFKNESFDDVIIRLLENYNSQ